MSTETILDNNEYRSVNQLETMQNGNEDVKAQIKHQLDYQYPYVNDTKKPSKQSVSELKRQYETEENNKLRTSKTISYPVFQRMNDLNF